MSPSNPAFPRRLAEGEDRAAELIARALAEPTLGPSEQHSWLKLQQRSRRVAPSWAAPVLAFGLCLAALFVWLSRPSPGPAMRPDTWARPPQALPTAPAGLTRPAPAKGLEPPPSQAEHPKAPPRAVIDGDAARCSKLAKAGQYEAATTCYGQIARGSGMAAELALYEKARLQAKAIGQPAQALATLDEHGQRFPGGVLSTEVGLTRIELLSQLGKRSQALSAIERGLQGALGRERGGDLQVLRADLLAAQGDCAAALEAVRLARQAGVHPSRLAATERRCPVESTTASPAAAIALSTAGSPTVLGSP